PPPRREPPAAEPAPARIHAPAETPKEKPAPAKAPAATALAPESEIVFDPIDEVIHKGDQLMKASEYGVAHQRFREAVLRDPKRADAHVKLARALYRDRFIDGFERTLEAVAHCKKAIALDGTYVPAYTTMLKILEEENMPAAALDVARRAVENNPGSEDMRARLRAAERRARGE
ncbi:hypothetical protein K8I61_17625, partial [bacterium]|nr:hypothetical protein [bacterium]